MNRREYLRLAAEAAVAPAVMAATVAATGAIYASKVERPAGRNAKFGLPDTIFGLKVEVVDDMKPGDARLTVTHRDGTEVVYGLPSRVFERDGRTAAEVTLPVPGDPESLVDFQVDVQLLSGDTAAILVVRDDAMRWNGEISLIVWIDR
jgi:hypothetical protein